MTKKEISNYYIDENIIRIIAAQVAILATLSLMNHWMFPLYLLVGDFLLRAFTHQPTPLVAVAKILLYVFKVKRKPIFAAPKKFAAGVGFVFSLSVLLLFLCHFNITAYVVGSILIICALLESVFKVCVGCYVYDWLVAPIINSRNNKTTPNIND